MIGFNSLGRFGRLGNQMFQYAALRGIAKNNNYEFCIPPSKHENEYTDHQLFQCFALKNVSALNIQFIDPNRPSVNESSFNFDEKLFNDCPDWVNLVGFFQSEKYFKNIEKEIREDFIICDSIKEHAEKIISPFDNPMALHVRRTDYITNPNHRLLPLQYYTEALSKFDSDRQVLVFTDEPEWALQQKIFEDNRFFVSMSKSNYIDMCLMTMCKAHIIANSSFSWWGAWLANSEKVVTPSESEWFLNTYNSYLNTKDLIPENWERIVLPEPESKQRKK